MERFLLEGYELNPGGVLTRGSHGGLLGEFASGGIAFIYVQIVGFLPGSNNPVVIRRKVE